MITLQYRFQCYTLGDCDIAIYSEFRESFFEAVQPTSGKRKARCSRRPRWNR